MRMGMMKKLALFGVALFLSGTALGQGGFTTPLYMSAVQPIADEFGNTLKGDAAEPSDLVVTYLAVNGVIEPPSTNGLPHVDTVEVVGGDAGVGFLAPLGITDPGVFSLAITGDGRPTTGQKIFVRVFNAPTIEEASFYTDSQLITVNNNDRFALVLNATDEPIDSGDDDGDGLHNSYEKSHSTDKGNPDTDGDGMNDGDEIFADNDPLDEDSALVISFLQTDGNDILLTWQSVDGRDYQPQVSSLLVGAGGNFSDIGLPVAATSTVTQIRIPDELLNTFHNYRVEVLPK